MEQASRKRNSDGEGRRPRPVGLPQSIDFQNNWKMEV